MKLKPLNWYDKPGRLLDGKSNGSVACDEVFPGYGIRLYIRYDVSRGATEATDDQWNILIQFPAEAVHEEVSSLEEGKAICAHYREKFWNGFYEKMMEKIFQRSDRK